MAKQKYDELLDHEYDGIKEYNNPLPGWWLWLFYGTIAFSAVYIPYYVLGFGPGTAEEYRHEVAAARAAVPAPAAAAAPAGGRAHSDGTAHPVGPQPAGPNLEGNPQAIAAGREIYAANCAPCHGPQGQGVIGPNLADRFWLHGNTYADIANVIANGVPDKGMIAWKAVLNPVKIQQVTAFVRSLKGTLPPNPKPPQGQEYKD